MPHPRSRRLAVALLAAALVLLTAATAQAVHWPFFGGDNGRSGNQPVDEGVTPVPFLYSKTAATEQFVKTSIITSAGSPATQRLIFGTANGNVHLQVLGTGAPVGPEAGIDVDDGTADADVFGAVGTAQSVSFGETSGPSGLGQVFVVHNDDDVAGPDIEVAQIDETTGARLDKDPGAGVDVDVAGTEGFTIESSALLTGPGAGGVRTLFFVATNGAGDGRLFRVPITGNAQTTDAVVNGAGATSTGDINATPLASPTLFFRNVNGTPTPFVAVGTTDGFVRTFAAADDDFSDPGPVASGLGGPVQTPSVPVQPDGMTPNPSGAVRTAPLVFVAAATAGTTTTVYELDGTTLATRETSEALPGAPAPALATDLESEPDIEEAKVVVTTGQNLFLLTTAGLDRAGQFDRESDLAPGTTGFAQTTAAASGDFAYVTNDQAQQFVVRLSDGKPVPEDEFDDADAAEAGVAGSGVGQPSISRGFIQFAGGTGVFVYRNTDATAPSVTLGSAPPAESRLTGTVTFTATAFDARGIASVAFRLNGQVVGTDTTPDSGSPFGPPGATFSTTVDTRTLPDGGYLLDAVATDRSGLTTTSAQRRVSVDNVAEGDDRPPEVAFTAPRSNALIRGTSTVRANASDDRGVRSVAFFDDDRLLCTDTTAPYDCPFAPRGDDVGRDTLFAVATDTSGQTGSAVRVVRVARFTPTALTARVTPRRDRRRPFRFTTTGAVQRPAAVTQASGCSTGRVSVQFKARRRTISTRRARLRPDCTYRSRVTFTLPRRFRGVPRLKVTARFTGNRVLTPRTAPRRFVRVR